MPFSLLSNRAVLLLATACSSWALLCPQARAQSINFDDVSAPPDFAGVTPGGVDGPVFTRDGVTFRGGVVLDGSGFANEETSVPNLYATSDSSPLADGSFLPGLITISLTAPANSITLDIANGFSAASFTMLAYDSANNLIGNNSIFLNAFDTPGAVGSLSLTTMGNIDHLSITSGQAPGGVDFAIDTVGLSVVPEPSTTAALFLGAGLFLLVPVLRRRVRAARS
jgi:hypothetical protein